MTLRALAARVRRYYPRWRLNKVVTDYGASNEVAVQTGFLFDFYPVLKVLLEPSIRLGRPNVEPSLFRTGANEVVWEFSDIKCGAHVLATGRIEDGIPLTGCGKTPESRFLTAKAIRNDKKIKVWRHRSSMAWSKKSISGGHNRGFLVEFLSLP